MMRMRGINFRPIWTTVQMFRIAHNMKSAGGQLAANWTEVLVLSFIILTVISGIYGFNWILKTADNPIELLLWIVGSVLSIWLICFHFFSVLFGSMVIGAVALACWQDNPFSAGEMILMAFGILITLTGITILVRSRI